MGGTLMANKLSRKLDLHEWRITIVDKDENHYYQPGFLFIPFGIYNKEEVVKPKKEFLPDEVHTIFAEVEQVMPENNQVLLADGRIFDYDLLLVATGATPSPEETPGLKEDLWYKKIFDFYTYEGACALADCLKTWQGGKLVVNIADMPIKCPIAPLEFVFLADDFFTHKGIRDQVEIIFSTPLSGAFTKPIATKMLSQLLEEKNIKVVPDFYIESVDNEAQKIRSYDGQELEFDLLVSIPTNKGSVMVENSGMGDVDDLNYIPTNKQTLQSLNWSNIFVIGDASNLPASKAGSVIHFEGDILLENMLSYIEGKPLAAQFDGHANCFIETGHGKATLIDFNYTTEPLPGKFPFAGLGPLSLLKESRFNHLGKMAFKYVYWHLLLKGYEIPTIHSALSMSGKELEPV